MKTTLPEEGEFICGGQPICEIGTEHYLVNVLYYQHPDLRAPRRTIERLRGLAVAVQSATHGSARTPDSRPRARLQMDVACKD